ncbi:MAG: hypothetical protein V4733_09490 [Verrucomicrobiota bacterium]
MVEVLNHLAVFRCVTLVLRQQGLTLAKSTSFGLSVAYGARDWKLLQDRASGLETDTSHRQDIHLLTDAGDPRPLLAFGRPGEPAELSIRLDGQTWSSPLVRDMIRRFNGSGLGCFESRTLGAGAWLDEWVKTPATPAREAGRDICRLLDRCRVVEVDVRTSIYRNVARFEPGFVDHDGVILRLADKSCRHVIYADTSASDFSFTCDPDGSALIRRAMAS